MNTNSNNIMTTTRLSSTTSNLKMLVISVILFSSIGSIMETMASSVCTEEKVNECYEMLNKDQLPPATVLYYSEEVMTEHCRRYKIFAECMNTIRPYCEKVANLSILAIQGVEDSYNFVCVSGFQDYLKYQKKCYREDDVQFEAKTCNDVFASRFDYLKKNITDMKYFRARYCQYVDDYIDCVHNLIKSFCGNDAAEWHLTFDRKSVEPTMVNLGCSGWPASTTASPSSDHLGPILVITLASVVAVTGIVVSASLIYIICSRCSCIVCRRSSSSHRSLLPDMPPPYSGPFIICRANDDFSSTASTFAAAGVSSRQAEDGRALPLYSSRPPSVSGSDKRKTKRRSRSSDGKSSISQSCSSGSAFESADETGAVGAVGGSPFIRPITPTGHFEMPSPSSSILSHLQSSDDDTSSLISHTCEYY